MPVLTLTDTELTVDCDGCKFKKLDNPPRVILVSDIKGYVGNDDKLYLKLPTCGECGGVTVMQPPPDLDSPHGHLKRCLAKKVVDAENVEFSADETRAGVEATKVSDAMIALGSFYTAKESQDETDEFAGSKALALSRVVEE